MVRTLQDHFTCRDALPQTRDGIVLRPRRDCTEGHRQAANQGESDTCATHQDFTAATEMISAEITYQAERAPRTSPGVTISNGAAERPESFAIRAIGQDDGARTEVIVELGQ